MKPRHLVRYVDAILHGAGPARIVRSETRSESWPDQGFTVRRDEATYWFDDGAVIRRVVEQDDFPTEVACAECWIDYAVLDAGALADAIEPSHQQFSNACREAFWLSYHRER